MYNNKNNMIKQEFLNYLKDNNYKYEFTFENKQIAIEFNDNCKCDLSFSTEEYCSIFMRGWGGHHFEWITTDKLTLHYEDIIKLFEMLRYLQSKLIDFKLNEIIVKNKWI